MRKVTSYKCPSCGMKYKTLNGWAEHVHRHHPDLIPEGFTDSQYFYYTITGRTSGSCVHCHKPTTWNEVTGKYNRYCNDPKCKQAYVKVAKSRMVDKYGKVHMLNDPEMQRKMLSGRKISGSYKFSDGSGSVAYVGSYERDFLQTMDTVLGYKATDIMSPSPHNYVYMYEGKPHFYIPDFYIPNLNLEIEIKDGGARPNTHHKIQAVDKAKEKLKDEVMAKNSSINYFKVVDEQYVEFFKYLLELKEGIPENAKLAIVDRVALEAWGNITYDEFGPGPVTPAMESKVFNVKDEYFNIDKWQKGKGTNILYVTGHSGSGKTTIGHQIADKYGAILIELDRVFTGEPSVGYMDPDKEFEADEILKTIFKDENDRIHDGDGRNVINVKRRAAVKRAYDYCQKHPNQLFVWEGIWLFTWFTQKYFIDRPLVIKGTSAFNSMKRSLFRDERVLNREGQKEYNAWFKHNEQMLEELKKFMHEHCEPSFELVVTESAKTDMESAALEQSHFKILVDKLDPEHKQKGKKSLSDFTRKPLTKDLIKKFKGKGKLIGSFRDQNPKYPEDTCVVWIDGDNYVGAVSFDTDPDEQGYKWISGLDVAYDYKSYGLGEQIVKYAMGQGVNALSVQYDNEIALRLYKKLGFKPSKISEENVKNGKNASYNLYLDPSRAIEAVVKPPIDVVPTEMFQSDFEAIPDSSIMSETRDNFLKVCSRNKFWAESIEAYGFYTKDKVLAGLVMTCEMPDSSKCIDLLVVDTPFRRQGLATYILDFARRQLQANWLSVKYTNEGARALYAKTGWVENLHEETHIVLVDKPKLKKVKFSGLKEVQITSMQQLSREFRMRYGEPKVTGALYAYMYQNTVAYLLHVAKNGDMTLKSYAYTIDASVREDILKRGVEHGGNNLVGVSSHDDQLMGYWEKIKHQLVTGESATPDPTLAKICELYEYIDSNFVYGLSRNGQKIVKVNTTYEDYDTFYHMADPKQFVKQGGGICWDYVTYTASEFKARFPGIKFKARYIWWELDPDYPTHTYLTFTLNGKTYYIENSFAAIKGVYEAKSEKDIDQFVINSMAAYEKAKHSRELNGVRYYLETYNPLSPNLPGSTGEEFMTKIVSPIQCGARECRDGHFEKKPVSLKRINHIEPVPADEMAITDYAAQVPYSAPNSPEIIEQGAFDKYIPYYDKKYRKKKKKRSED